MVSDSNIVLSADLELGARIEYGEQYGTVRYIGTIDGHNANWLGIDWDDPTRGKHDGSVAGKRYFYARYPTSGSFVRPGKVQLGKDIITAITSRYGRRETPSEANVNQLQLLDLQREIKAPFLEMVGFDKINEKQSNFNDLQIVSLRLQYVNGPGKPGELAQLCPNIVELDLSKNLISRWTDIFDICEQLTNLQLINLSENLLEFPDDIENICYPHITTLICGHMRLEWSDVLRISQIFPSLREIRVQYNFITQLQSPSENEFACLKILDLEGNHVENWNEINKLGSVLSLEQLIVSKLGLKEITLPWCPLGKKLSIFPNLRHIVLSDNLIDNWKSISELNKLQNLQHLRFLKNPILNTEKPATCLQFIIARIGTLSILNGAEIKMDERKGAEYDYIKKFALEWMTASQDVNLKNSFLELHPRYLELIEKYGLPEESELVYKTQTLKTTLVNINLKYNDRIVPKKLPLSMNVQKLVVLVQRIFRIEERPLLFCINSSQPEMKISMDDDFKEIGFFSIQNGDTIIVSDT